MSWRTVVINSNAKLDYQLGYLVVRKDSVKKVYLSEIRVLIIESTAVSLTAALLNELTKKKIKVIFCDEKRNPSSELISYYGSHDTSDKVRNQISWDSNIKSAVWTEIVTEKIRKQAEVLERSGKPKEKQLLEQYVTEIQFGDSTNREGHAAKVYFNALFGMDFTRSTESNINAALNYGYAILLSSFTREISANGYITQLGLFHDNMFNHFNLACDLMEPFRPIVDYHVKNMTLETFGHDQKMELIDLMNQVVIINEREEYVSNAIQIYCKSVFDALNNNSVSEIKFYQNEL